MQDKSFRLLVKHNRRNLINLDESDMENKNNENSLSSSTDEEIK
jgi:hypothetical protein